MRPLADALEARGKDVWVDLEDIRKGADWHAKMLAGIESARVIVPVLSPDFAQSKPCTEEIEHALAHNKRLVPILLRRGAAGLFATTGAADQATCEHSGEVGGPRGDGSRDRK